MSRLRFALNTIAARLVLVYVLLLLPVVLLDVRSIWTRLEDEQRAAMLRAREVAALVRDHIEAHLTESVAILTAAARIPGFHELPVEEQTKLLTQLHDDFPHFTNLSIVDSSGYITASSTPMDKPIYVGYSENIRTVFIDGEVGFGTPMTGVLTGETTIVVSYPMADDTKVHGALNAGVNLGWINEYLNRIQLEHEHLVVVYTGEREIIAARNPNPEMLPQHVTPSFDTQIRRLGRLSDGMGTATAPALGDISLLGAVTEIVRVPGGLIIAAGLPVELVQAPILLYLRGRVLSLFASLLVAVGLAWYLTQRLLLQQLEDLRLHSVHIATGNLHSRIPLEGLPNELRTLAESLNEMSARLEAHEQELNNMVQERTAELEEARNRAEKASAAKDSFVASVSHEVRTPLNGLLGMLQLMDHADLTQEQRREYLAVAAESGAHLRTLIDDLLDLSQIERGSLKLVSKAFNPIVLCKHLVEEFRISAQDRGIGLSFQQLCPTPNLHCMGDPARVRQILSNLLSNALRYTEQGEVRVALQCRQENTAVVFEFTVEDSGPGIAPEDHERIFERFTQLTEGHDRGKAGAGLGLAISRELARSMDGDIRVESEKGTGSRFCFFLSLEPVPADKMATKADTMVDEKANRQLHILVVEDDRISRLTMKHLVQRLGHSCEVVSTGKAALELLRSTQFDCVLLDQQLPDMNGTELLQQVRNKKHAGIDPAIPAVAVSAYAMEKDRQIFFTSGVSAYLTKPPQLEDLPRTLQVIGNTGHAPRST